MLELESLDEDIGGTVFRDVIMLALLGFVAIVVLLLPHLKPQVSSEESDIDPPGNVIIEIRWPDKMDTDVDLWVQAPGDVPVGYSNKGGLVFNLLRDDLGQLADATEFNYEISYSRGIPSGEYTVNVHLFINHEPIFPVPVTVMASVRKESGDRSKQIVTTQVGLMRNNQEVTAFRFRLDATGDLVPDSVHSLYRPLRAWKSG
jgi:hypothetical protein